MYTSVSYDPRRQRRGCHSEAKQAMAAEAHRSPGFVKPNAALLQDILPVDSPTLQAPLLILPGLLRQALE